MEYYSVLSHAAVRRMLEDIMLSDVSQPRKDNTVLKTPFMWSAWSEVKVAQSCPTLCDPMDYAVHGILQARILEWAAVPFSRGSSHPGIEPMSPALQADSLPAEP